MSPLLKSAEKAGIRGLRTKRNPANISPADFFKDSELLREEFAKLINAGNPKRIAIIPSVSYGMATVSQNLAISAGEKIIVAAEQFPSNYYPWQRLAEENGAEVVAIAPPEEPTSRGKIWNERILEAIDSKTRAVAIGNVHWADGTLFRLEEIRKRTRDVGALLIVDGTQSVGALPFDVMQIQPDALICAGYKWLLGPYSIGLAYYGEYFDDRKPIEENWINRLNSEDFTCLCTMNRYTGMAHFVMMLASIAILSWFPVLKGVQQLNRWGCLIFKCTAKASLKNLYTFCNNTVSGLKTKRFDPVTCLGSGFRKRIFKRSKLILAKIKYTYPIGGMPFAFRPMFTMMKMTLPNWLGS
jgi:kynureninase